MVSEVARRHEDDSHNNNNNNNNVALNVRPKLASTEVDALYHGVYVCVCACVWKCMRRACRW